MRVLYGLCGFLIGLTIMWFVRKPALLATNIPDGYYDLSALPDDIESKFSDPTFLDILVQRERMQEKFMADFDARPRADLPDDVPDFPFNSLFAPTSGTHWLTLADPVAEALLAEARDEWVILNIWATWCAPCVKELPDMQNAAPNLAEHGVRLIAINADMMKKDTPESVAKVLSDKGVTDLPNILALGSDVDAMLAATGLEPVGLPTSIIYAPGGKPVAFLQGLPPDDVVWNSEEMLAFFEALVRHDSL